MKSMSALDAVLEPAGGARLQLQMEFNEIFFQQSHIKSDFRRLKTQSCSPELEEGGRTGARRRLEVEVEEQVMQDVNRLRPPGVF